MARRAFIKSLGYILAFTFILDGCNVCVVSANKTLLGSVRPCGLGHQQLYLGTNRGPDTREMLLWVFGMMAQGSIYYFGTSLTSSNDLPGHVTGVCGMETAGTQFLQNGAGNGPAKHDRCFDGDFDTNGADYMLIQPQSGQYQSYAYPCVLRILDRADSDNCDYYYRCLPCTTYQDACNSINDLGSAFRTANETFLSTVYESLDPNARVILYQLPNNNGALCNNAAFYREYLLEHGRNTSSYLDATTNITVAPIGVALAEAVENGRSCLIPDSVHLNSDGQLVAAATLCYTMGRQLCESSAGTWYDTAARTAIQDFFDDGYNMLAQIDGQPRCNNTVPSPGAPRPSSSPASDSVDPIIIGVAVAGGVLFLGVVAWCAYRGSPRSSSTVYNQVQTYM